MRHRAGGHLRRGVLTLLLTRRRHPWQVMELAEERGLVVTSAEDIVCYSAANFVVPSFFESESR